MMAPPLTNGFRRAKAGKMPWKVSEKPLEKCWRSRSLPLMSPKKDIEAEVVYQHGNFLLKLGKMDMAIAFYSEAISLKNNYAEAYCNRGVAYREKGNIASALKDFDKAIQLEPKLAFAYNNLGVAYSEIQEYDLAIKNI